MRRLYLIFFIACLIWPMQPAWPQDQEKIPFYLPISSVDYPNLKHRLDAALFEAGLGQFSTQTTDYWHSYQQGLKLGRLGIYLAAPHFVAWANHQHDFRPLLKLESNTQYVLASRSRDIDLFEVDDLNDRPVCTQASLNLDFILLNQAFSNPLYSAKNIIVSNVAKEISSNNRNCHAFTIANHLFLKHNLAHPESLIRLQQGQAWPPYAWVMHPQLESHTKAMSKFLVSEKTLKILRPILRSFSEGEKILHTETRDYPPSIAAPLVTYWGDLLKKP